MTELVQCPQCGGPLPEDGALGGGCPRCMLELGFETTVGSSLRPELGIANARPSVIGRYRILRLIGEGGMGAVYEAEQDQPRRTVALKIIKSGMASAELLRRFEQESQALGRLQHPGIAQIYEAGTVDTGFGPQPYFAMELIRGQSPRDYAEANKQTTRDRLLMMVKICEAVHHAHQRGLIHRDLKPGNILVDETGQPKILDFGVARVTDSDTRATLQTDMGQLIGTLAYMSPEQALADPLDIDTRSDVYSLGVILYELLSGRLPYKVSKKVHEAIQAIREEDPARLSVSNRTFRGDIETIVSKALEKERDRRYASAAEMAADIKRYLNDEPIVARRPSRSYQLQKFARRNKALVTGVATVFVVLVAGVIAITWYAARVTQERDHAINAEHRASDKEREATEAGVRETDLRHVAEDLRVQTEAQALVTKQALGAAELNLYFNNIALADREWVASNVANSDRFLNDAPAPLRNWEWDYLSLRNHMEDAVIAGHQAAILAMVVSPDGKRIRTVSADNTVKDWDFEARKEISTVTLGESVSDVVLSSGGRVLFSIIDSARKRSFLTPNQQLRDLSNGERLFYSPTVTFDGQVALRSDGERLVGAMDITQLLQRRFLLRWWDTHTGDELPSLGEYTGQISHFTFSPDGSRLAFVENTSVRILNLETHQTVVALGHPQSSITALAFSADGATLASGSLDKGVRTWRTSDGMELWTNSVENVKRLAFSSDSHSLAAALGDQAISLMDGATGREFAQLKGHSGAIRALGFTPRGTQLVSVGDDKLVHIWNLNATIPPIILNTGRIENFVKVSSDGNTLMTLTRNGVKSWDTNTGLPGFQRAFVASDIAVEFSADAAGFVLANKVSNVDPPGHLERGDLLILDARTGRDIALLHSPLNEEIGNLVTSDFWVSSDGGRAGLVSYFSTLGESPASHSAVQIWETTTGKRISNFRIDNAMRGRASVRFSPSGKLLAIGTAIGNGSKLKRGVDIYNTTTGRRVLKLDVADTGLLVFSPEGKHLAVVGPGRVITIWDAETGMKLVSSREVGRAGTDIVNIAFNPDGTRLVSVSTDGEVWLWDTNSGKELLLLCDSSGPYMLREISVVAEKGGTLLTQLANETERSISFSPDGRKITLATIAPDPKGASVRIETWDGSPRQN